jgi:hypothetical protein
MKMKIGDLTYRAPLAILVKTEMVGKFARETVHTCHIDGFKGTRKQMLWHLKVEHRKDLEVA